MYIVLPDTNVHLNGQGRAISDIPYMYSKSTKSITVSLSLVVTSTEHGLLV